MKVLRLTKIGLFRLSEEGNIIFSQDSKTNYNLDSFGMQSTYNKSIIRKTETTKQVEVTLQRIKNTNISTRTFLRAAAIIIPLVALSYLSVSQQERINDVYTQKATLNPFASAKTANKIFRSRSFNFTRIFNS